MLASYKHAYKEVSVAVAKAKSLAFKDLIEASLKEIRIGKQKSRKARHVDQGKQMNDSKEEMLTDEGDTRDRWRFYFEQLMNVENEKIETIVQQREETRI